MYVKPIFPLLCWLFGAVYCSFPLWGQTQGAFIVVDSMVVTGNKVSKAAYLFRELTFGIGDTLLIKDLESNFTESEDNLLNTDLFNKVDIDTLKVKNNHALIKLDIEERWRVYPIPTLQVIDQNYNVWLQDHNADLRRLVYGAYFNMYNLRGRGESIIASLELGYSRLAQFRYIFPYIDKRKQWGLKTRLEYIGDRQVYYQSDANKLQYFPADSAEFIPDQPLMHRWTGNITLKNKKRLNTAHFVKLNIHHIQIDNLLASLNPQFLNPNQLKQTHFSLSYAFEHDRRDLINYPLNGWYLRVEANKHGLGIFNEVNTFELVANVSKYHQLSERWFIAGNFKAFKTWGNQNYYTNPKIGFGRDFVRGFEANIIDTQAYFLIRSNLRYKFWEFILPNPIRKRKIPVACFFRFHNDLSRGQDELFDTQNPYNNQWLTGTGVALDVVFWENVPMSLEYTFNNQGKRAWFIHFGLSWDYWRSY